MMKSSYLLLMTGVAFWVNLSPAAESSPIELGEKRELFVDRYLIDRMDDVRLELGRPRDEGVVLKFDKPWEGPFCGYCTILKRESEYRVYYRGLPEARADGSSRETTCVAVSRDGIAWTKPELDLYEVDGTKQNNVVLANAAPVTHNFSPFLDTRPGVAPKERFKGIGGTQTSGLIPYTSEDGFRWARMREKPILAKPDVPFPYMFDSQNLIFWSERERKYVCFFRVFKDKIRRIARVDSADFQEWSPPTLMEYRHAGGEAPIEQLYTSQTHPYFRAPHLYVSLAARFFPGRQALGDDEAKALGVNPDTSKIRRTRFSRPTATARRLIALFSKVSFAPVSALRTGFREPITPHSISCRQARPRCRFTSTRIMRSQRPIYGGIRCGWMDLPPFELVIPVASS